MGHYTLFHGQQAHLPLSAQAKGSGCWWEGEKTGLFSHLFTIRTKDAVLMLAELEQNTVCAMLL